MSDPRKLEHAARHFDPAAVQAWAVCQPTPAEEMMRKEEPSEEPVVSPRLFVMLLVYCFADLDPGSWEVPAARALSTMRRLVPELLQRRDATRARELLTRDFACRAFPMEELRPVDEEELECFARIMDYIFPTQGDWVKEGARRLFLLAKAYTPREVSETVLSRDQVRFVVHEMSFEALGVVFGDMPAGADKQSRGRVRARWCALKTRLIEKPVLAVGGRITCHFSKSATTREKYRLAQMGNQNRKGRKG